MYKCGWGVYPKHLVVIISWNTRIMNPIEYCRIEVDTSLTDPWLPFAAAILLSPLLPSICLTKDYPGLTKYSDYPFPESIMRHEYLWTRAELLTESHPTLCKVVLFSLHRQKSLQIQVSACTLSLWQVGHNRRSGCWQISWSGSQPESGMEESWPDGADPSSHVSHLGRGESVHQCGHLWGRSRCGTRRVRRLFGPEWRWVAPGQICVHWLPTHFKPRLRYATHLASTQTSPPPAPHLGGGVAGGTGLPSEHLTRNEHCAKWNVGKGSTNMGPPIWLNPSHLFLELIHSCVFTFHRLCGMMIFAYSCWRTFMICCFR